ncbi:hypothetical protein [Haloquadratum walsbyi]|jgi:hypothetical protein|uniref:Uncharacterized protein n=1 Tax=Haloquadratum walsbyi J07HQW2 TaxID=1238425 RepID=U1PV63_9EURY|nr:hypothetical protein [Haloquadratum walsbyi]ERG96286.1 MAG: hypothetical protein J07HQW2_02761 [Haloquadratum walsbyi J07HQW2]
MLVSDIPDSAVSSADSTAICARRSYPPSLSITIVRQTSPWYTFGQRGQTPICTGTPGRTRTEDTEPVGASLDNLAIIDSAAITHTDAQSPSSTPRRATSAAAIRSSCFVVTDFPVALPAH